MLSPSRTDPRRAKQLVGDKITYVLLLINDYVSTYVRKILCILSSLHTHGGKLIQSTNNYR